MHALLTIAMLFLQAEGEDDLKKMQLMELAILNGTFRDHKSIPIHARKCPVHHGLCRLTRNTN